VFEALARRVLEVYPATMLPALAYGYFLAFCRLTGQRLDRGAPLQRYCGRYHPLTGAPRHQKVPVARWRRLNSRTTAHAFLEVAPGAGRACGGWQYYGIGSPVQAAIAEQASGGHADEIETSCMLAIRPDLVRIERGQGDRFSASRHARKRSGAKV
jgi:creatinine amidohydrolase/Fe(II)-dependent formamide hydrolase-like protein